MLFSEPKIPQSISLGVCNDAIEVSVLFSEPKIPQLLAIDAMRRDGTSFSALQRAENSSIRRTSRSLLPIRRFQCSSASRKFLNAGGAGGSAGQRRVSVLFSEPKIPQCWYARRARYGWRAFQCSSASRKFLNVSAPPNPAMPTPVSVLFSEPKIPQSRPSHLRPSIFPTAMITLRHS